MIGMFPQSIKMMDCRIPHKTVQKLRLSMQYFSYLFMAEIKHF